MIASSLSSPYILTIISAAPQAFITRATENLRLQYSGLGLARVWPAGFPTRKNFLSFYKSDSRRYLIRADFAEEISPLLKYQTSGPSTKKSSLTPLRTSIASMPQASLSYASCAFTSAWNALQGWLMFSFTSSASWRPLKDSSALNVRCYHIVL